LIYNISHYTTLVDFDTLRLLTFRRLSFKHLTLLWKVLIAVIHILNILNYGLAAEAVFYIPMCQLMGPFGYEIKYLVCLFFEVTSSTVLREIVFCSEYEIEYV
jgi:hypothetical protein